MYTTQKHQKKILVHAVCVCSHTETSVTRAKEEGWERSSKKWIPLPNLSPQQKFKLPNTIFYNNGKILYLYCSIL